MVPRFGSELLCPKHMGIADVEAADSHADAGNQVQCERIFVHTMAVLEGVSVEKYVAQDGFPV